MDTSGLITLLAITIALSAYLASIRLALITKISDLDKQNSNNKEDNIKKEEEKATIKMKLYYLAWADIPLVIGSVILFIYIFWDDLFVWGKPSWLFTVCIYIIFMGVIILAGSHFATWRKTHSEFKKALQIIKPVTANRSSNTKISFKKISSFICKIKTYFSI